MVSSMSVLFYKRRGHKQVLKQFFENVEGYRVAVQTRCAKDYIFLQHKAVLSNLSA